MGRKALLAVVCWLALSEALGEAVKNVNSSVAENKSADSAPRLYRNVPVGVYASRVPHGAFSFNVPVFSPAVAASNANAVVQHTNGYLKNLKDSYGKFVETPQTVPYKTAFPQEFVQLQELPAHLSQPLIAAAPSFQYKHTAPHFFFGSQQYKIPNQQQAATPTPITRFSSPSQPLVYAEKIRNFAPSSNFPNHGYRFQNAQIQQQQHHPQQQQQHHPQQQQHLQPQHQQQQQLQQQQLFNKIVQANTASIQRLQQPQLQIVADQSRNLKENAQIQAAPAQTSVTAIVNGKKTVITLDTKPPVPLLDLNLLEPLTFENPLVPQVQHFLPRINAATYHKLPEVDDDSGNNRQKELVLHNTKSFDSGIVVGKPKKAPNKKQKKPQNVKPTITVSGSPEFSYEINAPNYKETYNEQVLSYNKETNMKPISFSYDEKTKKDPVTYSFVRNSKEPIKVKNVEFESDPETPKQLVYTFSPEEQEEEEEKEEAPPQAEDEDDSEEYSAESEDEGPASQPQRDEPHSHDEAPRQHHHQTHRNEKQSYPQHHSDHHVHHDSPRSQHHSDHHHHDDDSDHESPRNSEQHDGPSHGHHHSHHHEGPSSGNHHHGGHREGPPSEGHHHSGHHDGPSGGRHYSSHHKGPSSASHHHGDHHDGPPSEDHHQSSHHDRPSSGGRYHDHEDSPRGGHHHSSHHEEPSHHPGHHHSRHYGELKESPRQSKQQRPEHREQDQPRSSQEIKEKPGKFFSQPLTVTLQDEFQAITPEYEEDIRLLPAHQPHRNANIKTDSKQHVPLGPAAIRQESAHPSSAPQQLALEQPDLQGHSPTQRPYSSPKPHILEKSKQIIIKQQEEAADLGLDAEQLMAQMIAQAENSEEDFEKAYKASAYGFPAYEEADTDKDVYDAESYGTPRYHKEYDIENTPFEQYQEQGDQFPKSARLTYKDSRDKNKDEYFIDYSISKPESYTDRFRKKEKYFKDYARSRPAELFSDKKKNKQKEKYTAAPSFTYQSSTKPKQKQYFAQYKAPPKYEYDYSKEAPRDSNAYASHSQPFRNYKTRFVEPQFQYGFEPMAAPVGLDSELAAMATNDSPESEKPGVRKKVYKENWYIKKTSVANKPS